MGILYDVSVQAIKQQIYRIFNDREFQKKAALFYLGHLMELIVMDDGGWGIIYSSHYV